MAIPVPGKPVRGSQSGAPIMALFDLLGRSWAMGIVWNLNEGPLNFRELQERCESVSPTTLSKRIKELRETMIVTRTDVGYTLTPSGRKLYEHMQPLSRWSKAWARRLEAQGRPVDSAKKSKR